MSALALQRLRVSMNRNIVLTLRAAYPHIQGKSHLSIQVLGTSIVHAGSLAGFTANARARSVPNRQALLAK